MDFYKQATEGDFEKALEEVGDYIPESIREMIENENNVTPYMVQLYRNVTMTSLLDCKITLEKYLTVIRAYTDFKNGKIVYTKY